MSDGATWELDREIPSVWEEAFHIIRQVTQQLTSFSWSEPEVFGIHLALEEALVNAIKHGNAGRADMKVHVTVQVSLDRFHCVVTDQGPGFDPQAVPDPTREENVGRDCGRGIALMREFMDTVKFEGRGNRVEMCRQRRR